MNKPNIKPQEITSEIREKTLERYQKQKITFCLKERFFGMLAGLLNPIVCDKITATKDGITAVQPIDTMAVDGKNIYISPFFAESLQPAQYRFVIAHELMHCALGHFARRQWRDPMLSNIAQDYVINGELDYYFASKGDFAKAPDDLLLDHKFDGMAWEEVYNLLLKNAKKINISQDVIYADGDGKGDKDGEGAGSGEAKKLSEQWENAVLQASHAAKQQGALPSVFKEIVDNLIEPKIDFRSYFFNFVAANVKDDYCWMKPDPRFFSMGIYLPTLYGERLGPIALAVDTSGSVSSEDFREVIGVAQNILQTCRPEKMVFIQCDAQIQEIQEFEPEQSLAGLELKGRGGTDFRPVFKALEKYQDLECLVFLTDLYGSFPDKEPKYRTLWMTTTRDYKAPFGETIQL